MQETMLRAGTKYKVAYSTFITMPDGRRKEIITFSTKGMANHSTGMMKKTRDAIHSQVEELGLDVRLGLGVLDHCIWKRMSFGIIFGFLLSMKLAN